MEKQLLNSISAKLLSREEMKKIKGGTDPIPNTWFCDCGVGTSAAAYGANWYEAMLSYVESDPDCTEGYDVTCVPWG